MTKKDQKGSDMATFPITAVRSTYKTGNLYKHGPLGEEYVLAQVDNGKVGLISMGGNRFNDPIHVKNVKNITDEEWDLISCSITGVDFIPIEEFEHEQPSENVCICKKTMIPEIIPDISIGFRQKGSTILCYLQVKNKLRVGVSDCSGKDSFNPRRGEKIALRRALAQHDLCHLVRSVLWEQYLVTKAIKPLPSCILDFFNNIHSFNIHN